MAGESEGIVSYTLNATSPGSASEPQVCSCGKHEGPPGLTIAYHSEGSETAHRFDGRPCYQIPDAEDDDASTPPARSEVEGLSNDDVRALKEAFPGAFVTHVGKTISVWAVCDELLALRSLSVQPEVEALLRVAVCPICSTRDGVYSTSTNPTVAQVRRCSYPFHAALSALLDSQRKRP